MRAVRLLGVADAVVVDAPVPTPAPGEVLVRVTHAAVCGTDRKAFVRGTPSPRILGHELAGILEDGAAVAVHPEVSCGTCRHCAGGFENRCPTRRSIGLERDGGFAEFVAAPRDRLLPLDARLDPALGPLLEPLACCVRAVDMLQPTPGELAIVVGAGAIGLLSAWLLQAAGCRVAIVQRSAERRAQALALGVDVAVGPDDDVAAALGGEPELAVVAAPDAGALHLALERVVTGGRIHAMAGVPGGAMMDANVVHYRHLTVLGSTGSTLRDHRAGHDLVVTGRVPLARLPVRTIALEEVPDALRAPVDPTALRTIVEVTRSADTEAI
jgi:L-iditol 2-dehydrogenase